MNLAMDWKLCRILHYLTFRIFKYCCLLEIQTNFGVSVVAVVAAASPRILTFSNFLKCQHRLFETFWSEKSWIILRHFEKFFFVRANPIFVEGSALRGKRRINKWRTPLKKVSRIRTRRPFSVPFSLFQNERGQVLLLLPFCTCLIAQKRSH